MTFEMAFRKILLTYGDIQQIPDHEGLFEVETPNGWQTMTESQVIEFATNL